MPPRKDLPPKIECDKLDKILKAVKGSRGVFSLIAKRLGVEWSTARIWVGQYQEAELAVKNEKEIGCDTAEMTIFKAIQEGDVGSAKWFLSMQARHRGYGDRIEIENKGEIVIIPAPQPKLD